MPEVPPSPEQVGAALEEVLEWPGIARSTQVADLLRYVVEKTLAGNDATIKAYSIAVDVFGRPPSFDPQSDPIVRVQARRLRMLLDQFYESGLARSGVRISLPLGRYVPEFHAIAESGGAAALAEDGGSAEREGQVPAGGRRWRRPVDGFARTVFLGACLTIIGVALVVYLIRILLPPPAGGPVPDFPRVVVGVFDNLTGQDSLDVQVAAVAGQVREGLRKFELLRVVDHGGNYQLRATVQQNGAQFSVKAMLSRDGSDGIVWSTVVAPPAGTSGEEALDAASTELVAILGSPTGPLHAPDRAWLAQQTSPPAAQPYLCALEYMAWRDQRKIATATEAAQCLQQVLAQTPDDGTMLAEHAGLSAWIKTYGAPPGVDMVPLLADEATEAGRAVSLAPTSSFAYQQQGLVLTRQGLTDAALGALKKAVDLNPASMDALAVYALVQWGHGDYAAAVANSDRAIAGVPSPPPYFYITRAYEALRQRRYYDAIDAAQALSAGDEELGPVIVLAAAPFIGRNDLIDRYRPMILDNPRFQAVGILKRLAGLRSPVLIDRVREGLVLAGISPAALDAPFKTSGGLKGQP